jgi:hypothetical protein
MVAVSPRAPVIVAVAGLAMVAAAAALWRLHPPAPLVIGYISSLSGKYAALGSSARDGFTIDAAGDAHRWLVLHTIAGGALRRCE